MLSIYVSFGMHVLDAEELCDFSTCKVNLGSCLKVVIIRLEFCLGVKPIDEYANPISLN